MSIIPASEIERLMLTRKKEAEDVRLGRSKRQQEQYLVLVEDFNKFIREKGFPSTFIGTDHQGDKPVWDRLHTELDKSGYSVGDVVWVPDFKGDFYCASISILGVI